MFGGIALSFGPELIWSWSRELSALAGRRVQRVEGGGSAVIISLAGGAELLLSWGAQNCGAAVISERDKKSLLAAARQTPPITNAVKSHLTGAQLVSVAQLHRDRILEFTFRKTIGAGFSTERRLVLEIMERFSNLVMTDENGLIIETAKHITRQTTASAPCCQACLTTCRRSSEARRSKNGSPRRARTR